MSFASFVQAHAANVDWRVALAQSQRQIQTQVAARAAQRAESAPFTLGWCYLSDYYAPAAEAILDELRLRLPGVAWVGTIGVGVAASGVEYIDEPALALMVAGLLWFTWRIPAVMQIRFIAFVNPWSTAELVVNGRHLGITISQGPGYQIQQSLYAVIAGGLGGTGLGFGSPEYVPLAQSDFIFAALLEEMGAVVGFAVLALFAILLFRLLRLAVLLPREQTFERMLLTGIAFHLFIQMFIMVGGTLLAYLGGLHYWWPKITGRMYPEGWGRFSARAGCC